MSKKITTERHYRITLTGGSTYYGRTTQPGNQRYNEHLYHVRQGTHVCLQESYDKYGCEGWIHEWLSTETGNIEHHRQIEFGYVQADPKALNIHDGKVALLSKEEQIEYRREKMKKHIQQQIDNMPPKELKEYRTKNALKHQQRRDNETPEEKEERRRKDREDKQRKIDKETPEQREERLRKGREYYYTKRDEKKRGGDNK